MDKGSSGLTVAAPLWNSFMVKFIDSYSSLDFLEPEKEKINKPMLGGFLEDKITLRIDKKSGNLATKNCKEKYTKKKTFQKTHSILYYVEKDNPRGDYPKKPENDPQFKNWERAVKKWASQNGIEDSPPTKTSCKGKDDDD
jgi:membrane carboxypeptidase/penicillin-binding protein